MKAWVFHEYGSPDGLRFEEAGTPEPEDDEVLIRIRAAGANAADWRILRGDPYLIRLIKGVRRPRSTAILGSDVAGVVEAAGAKATRFPPRRRGPWRKATPAARSW